MKKLVMLAALAAGSLGAPVSVAVADEVRVVRATIDDARHKVAADAAF